MSEGATYGEDLELFVHGPRHVGARFSFEKVWEVSAKEHACGGGDDDDDDDDEAENYYHGSDSRSRTRRKRSICHFDDFPRALATIADTFMVERVRLKLAKGTWDEAVWGRNADGGAGTGAELWAQFFEVGDDGEEGEDWKWRGLTEALGGLYCVSLGLMGERPPQRPRLMDLDHPSVRSRPSQREGGASSSSLLRGVLPRETVCTENLTPLIKNLPCRKHAGLGALLHPTVIFSASYYSLGVSLDVEWDKETDRPTKIKLTQTLHAVWYRNRAQLDEIYSSASGWNLRALLSPNAGQSKEGPGGSILDSCWHAQGLRVTFYDNPTSWESKPALLGSHVVLRGESVSLGGGLGIPIPHPSETRGRLGELQMEHSLSGKGGLDGVSVSVLSNRSETEREVTYLQIFPRSMEPLFGTARLCLGGIWVNLPSPRLEEQAKEEDKNHGVRVSISSSSRAGDVDFWVFELALSLPPNSSSTLEIKFLKKILLSNEFPPDASRGFDIPAPVMMWRDAPLGNPTFIYGLGPLLDSPQPDQSMPFNVITLTCTAIAFFVGTIMNTLVRKSEWKDLAKRGAGKGGGIKARLMSRFMLIAKRLRLSKFEDRELSTKPKVS